MFDQHYCINSVKMKAGEHVLLIHVHSFNIEIKNDFIIH